MKKKILIMFSAIIVTVILIAAVSVANIDAATCSTGTYTCEGECCLADSHGCKAGPCDIIFPN